MRIIVAMATVALLAACVSKEDTSASAVQSASAPTLANAAPAHDASAESGKAS